MCFLSAYCKNSVDGQWYCFDDSDVQQLSENEVCKQTAYILFYQRRTAIPSWSANSSVAGKPRWRCQGVVLVCLSWIVCPSGEFPAQLCLSPRSLSQDSVKLVWICCCASEAVGNVGVQASCGKEAVEVGGPLSTSVVIVLRAALATSLRPGFDSSFPPAVPGVLGGQPAAECDG